MPSPLGHLLGGIAAGHLLAGRVGSPSAASSRRVPGGAGRLTRLVAAVEPSWPGLALFGALGVLPDIDFLFGVHSRYTHSLGAAAIVFGLGLVAFRSRRRPALLAAGMAAAYASHALLDWLGRDTTPPIGIMALWPFTNDFYQSDLHWFPAIRREFRDGIVLHNAAAALWELLVLGPLAMAAVWLRRRKTERARS